MDSIPANTLERLGLRYGVAIRGELTFWTAGARRADTAAVLADASLAAAWRPVTWGTGTAGPLTAAFYALRVRARPTQPERWLLSERAGADRHKFYLLNLPATAALPALVALARARWPIEQQYRELKDDLGLDHFEGRTYQGWAHHVVLTIVAFTFLQLERGRDDAAPRPTLPVVRDWIRQILGLLYVIHNRQLLRTLHSFERNPPLRR